MPGSINSWPAWPEFKQDDPASIGPDFQAAKDAVIKEYGIESLQKAWLHVCSQLESITDGITAQGSSIIPVVSAADVLPTGFSDDIKQRIFQTGCVIVRGIIPEIQARQLHTELAQYINDNRGSIRAWPAESPSMYELNHTPVQNIVRSNSDHLKLQRILNELWHDSTGTTSPDPLVYLDVLRDRPPHQQFLGLGPHIDAGSLARWADPTYRKAYSCIFSGKPEEHDAWDLKLRKDAIQDLYKAKAHSSVFRAFQGWTALTPASARQGSILLYPNLKAATAYIMLRPFFRAPERPEDLMDATKWTFDATGGFPGTKKEQSQRVSISSHPHLRLEQCLVHVPAIRPGDTVWWHSDICHAVDPEHEGEENASVLYIAACPTTPTTSKYVKQQLADTLAGMQPYDSSRYLDETKLKGYKGHVGLSEEARKAFGYSL